MLIMEYNPLLSEEISDGKRDSNRIVADHEDKAANIHQLSSRKKETDNDSTEEEVYTVEEAVNQLGFGLFQIAATLFSGMTWVRKKQSKKKERTKEREEERSS